MGGLDYHWLAITQLCTCIVYAYINVHVCTSACIIHVGKEFAWTVKVSCTGHAQSGLQQPRLARGRLPLSHTTDLSHSDWQL